MRHGATYADMEPACSKSHGRLHRTNHHLKWRYAICWPCRLRDCHHHPRHRSPRRGCKPSTSAYHSVKRFKLVRRFTRIWIQESSGEHFPRQIAGETMRISRRSPGSFWEFVGGRKTSGHHCKRTRFTGWLASLVRHWKADQAIEEMIASISNISWVPRLQEMVMGQWRVVPIDSSDALVRESFAMRNCLRNLLTKCATGSTEIYSVREPKTGKRVCCIGLQIDADGSAQLADVKGFANSKAPDEFFRLANALAIQIDQKMQL